MPGRPVFALAWLFRQLPARLLCLLLLLMPCLTMPCCSTPSASSCPSCGWVAFRSGLLRHKRSLPTRASLPASPGTSTLCRPCCLGLTIWGVGLDVGPHSSRAGRQPQLPLRSHDPDEAAPHIRAHYVHFAQFVFRPASKVVMQRSFGGRHRVEASSGWLSHPSDGRCICHPHQCCASTLEHFRRSSLVLLPFFSRKLLSIETRYSFFDSELPPHLPTCLPVSSSSLPSSSSSKKYPLSPWRRECGDWRHVSAPWALLPGAYGPSVVPWNWRPLCRPVEVLLHSSFDLRSQVWSCLSSPLLWSSSSLFHVDRNWPPALAAKFPLAGFWCHALSFSPRCLCFLPSYCRPFPISRHERWCQDSSRLACQRSKMSKQVCLLFGRIDVPTRHFSHVHLDLVGPLPAVDGFSHVFTAVDCSTLWPAAYPVRNNSAKNCVAALTTLILSFGVPTTLTSDRGAQFTSSGINHVTTPPQLSILSPMAWWSWCTAGLRRRSWLVEASVVAAAELVFASPPSLPGQFLSSLELPLSEFLDLLHSFLDPFVTPPLVHSLPAFWSFSPPACSLGDRVCFCVAVRHEAASGSSLQWPFLDSKLAVGGRTTLSLWRGWSLYSPLASALWTWPS